MGENIGAAARAMLNCGLDQLRIVNPRDGWPNERADAMAAGALQAMPPVQVFDTLEAALADCHYALATTARPRDMVKEVFTPRAGAAEIDRRHKKEGQRTAFVYGAERSGLSNDDVALCHGVITIPLNPSFSSLNLGQAVLLTTYEWSHLQDGTPPRVLQSNDSPVATHDVLAGLMTRLEEDLEKTGFFRSAEQKPSMVRNLKNLFVRGDMTEQEARTFHGIISALTGKNQKN